jgi:mandelate racemase
MTFTGKKSVTSHRRGYRSCHQAAARRASSIEISSHLFAEVSVHLLAASPTAHWLEYVDWADPILQQPLELSSGYAMLPARIGNGLAWNVDAVKRYRVE